MYVYRLNLHCKYPWILFHYDFGKKKTFGLAFTTSPPRSKLEVKTDIMHSQAQTTTTLFGANAYGLHTGNVAKLFPCRFFRRKIGMILIANRKKFLQILQFSAALFESNLKTDVTNLEPRAKPHASENLKGARLKQAFSEHLKHANFLNFRFLDLKILKHSNKASM